MPHDIPRGIPCKYCGGTFVLSRRAIHKGLWGHLRCDGCGALADTIQMGVSARDMPEWHDDPEPRNNQTASNSRRPQSKSRLAACGIAFMAVVLGVVWGFGLDIADMEGIVLDGIGDFVDGGSAALNDLTDAARETVDMVESRPDIPVDLSTTNDNTADLLEGPSERANEGMVGSPADTAAVAVEVPQSPLDRTIYPDGTVHGSRSSTSEPSPQFQQTKTELVEDLVYDMANQHREAAGLEPLARISKIDQIARSHSEDMANRNYFEHDTPEGLDPTDRGNAAGYGCRKDHGSYYTVGLAENIWHWPGGGMFGAERLADEMIRGWMNSPGHRQNILHSDYDRIGVGVAIRDGDVYATQNFC